MRKIYLAQAEISQQNPNARKGVGLACKTTPFVQPSATIPPVIDVYGEYYRGGSLKKHKPRAAARPINTIPGFQDITVLEGLEGGKKPRKPRITQARPISAKPLTRDEITLDNLQKELVRAETQTFNPHYAHLILPEVEAIDTDTMLKYMIATDLKNIEYENIAKEQQAAYKRKKESRLVAEKKAKEHGTYYYELPKHQKDLLEYLKKFG